MVEPRMLQGLNRLCNIRSKIDIRSVFFAGFRLDISRRAEPYESSKALLQRLKPLHAFSFRCVAADYSVAVGSKRICKVRAKIIKGSAGIILPFFSLPVVTAAVPGHGRDT
jgi:hypothetical protein